MATAKLEVKAAAKGASPFDDFDDMTPGKLLKQVEDQVEQLEGQDEEFDLLKKWPMKVRNSSGGLSCSVVLMTLQKNISSGVQADRLHFSVDSPPPVKASECFLFPLSLQLLRLKLLCLLLEIFTRRCPGRRGSMSVETKRVQVAI